MAARMSRRDFLKVTAFLGGSAIMARALEMVGKAEAKGLDWGTEYTLADPGNILYSSCLQCNTGCPIKVKIIDGIVAKIDGNPYSPWNFFPHIKYSTPVKDVALIDGGLCPKGHAGIQTYYDPYRIVKVLKRAGLRGENKWVTIPFEKAIEEIVNGGYLFKDVLGEESRYVEGLKDVLVLRDPKLAKEMKAGVEEIWREKDKERKKELLAAFRERFKDNLDKLISPEHPDLGPKNNQFAFMWGRMKGGRSDLVKRFVVDTCGSTNAHGHTTVCQGSLYFTGKAMSEQYLYDPVEGKYKWTGGDKFYFQADEGNAEFIIFVGAGLFEGNYGPTNRAMKAMEGVVDGRLKFAVLDPRFSKLASKAWKWVPTIPGRDAAFAWGIVRWILENKRYDERYLRSANKKAASDAGEPTFTNASWLVKKDGKWLHASEIGLEKIKKKEKVGEKEVEAEFDPFVVMINGMPTPFDPYDEASAAVGDLFVSTTLKDLEVKSALQLVKEEAESRTIAEWAALSGAREEDVILLAKEFTSHGKRAVVDIHRGVSQHTNGFYNVGSWFLLNLLLGNNSWLGGQVQLSTYSGAKGAYDVGKHPAMMAPFGISIIRHGIKYEDTTIFAGYPARRPWFPLSSDIYQEIIPSIGDAYPYPVKILMLYMGAPNYSLPAGHTNTAILSDLSKVPLFVAVDIGIGVTSTYADYVFPDLTYLERWELHGSHPSIIYKAQPVRNPVATPLTETVRVYGEEMPVCLEAFFLAMAERMGLKGFGKDGFEKGVDLLRMDDFYLRQAANVAIDAKVPEANDEEIELFLRSRRHLPPTVYDPARWQRIAGNNWKRVVYLLNRGGAYEDFEEGKKGKVTGWIKNVYKKSGQNLINLYQEKTATTKNSMTGKPFLGLPKFTSLTDSLGNELQFDPTYDLAMITHREISQTKSRTNVNYWLLSILPENYLLLNERDAIRLGFKDGDLAKVISPSNLEGEWDLKALGKKPMAGKIRVSQMIAPGVVAFSLGFGNWANGASDVVIDGTVIKGDVRRGEGIHANAAMLVDPYLKNTCLSDLTGGSAVFYDTKVRLVKM